MRLNRRYLPSLGFIILLTTIISTTIFINWIFSPFNYEKAMILEQKAHRLTKDGKLKEASKYFLKSAKIKDDNISTSRRYRCVGSTTQNIEAKIKYFKLALKYNPNNRSAKLNLNRYLKEKGK